MASIQVYLLIYFVIFVIIIIIIIIVWSYSFHSIYFVVYSLTMHLLCTQHYCYTKLTTNTHFTRAKYFEWLQTKKKEGTKTVTFLEYTEVKKKRTKSLEIVVTTTNHFKYVHIHENLISNTVTKHFTIFFIFFFANRKQQRTFQQSFHTIKRARMKTERNIFSFAFWTRTLQIWNKWFKIG